MKWFMKRVALSILVLVFFNACSEKTDNEYVKASSYCVQNEGIVTVSEDDGSELCQIQEQIDYDDGVDTYSVSCDLYDFYQNQGCLDDITNENLSADLSISDENITLSQAFYKEASEILNKLNHTGYTHRVHGPFVLHPNYTSLTYLNENNQTDLNSTIENYNLFLDCSGFVGYYLIQGVAKELYEDVRTCYHSTRPLAADFADAFLSAQHNVSDANVTDALLSDLDNNSSNIMWGRVLNIADAKAGDILVYKHTENITKHGDCNYSTGGKNTGHIMLIIQTPKLSTYYTKHNEYLVKVADSTTAPHFKDSRLYPIKDGETIYNKSKYGDSNTYTAWTKRNKDDYLELCKGDGNNTFHRRCSDYSLERELQIIPQTGKIDSSTGIGSGYIYISKDMDHYRVKKYAEWKQAEVYIGRAIKNKI